MKHPKKPQAVSIAPGAVAAPGAISELLQFREDSLTAQLGGAMARAMKGAGPSGIFLCNTLCNCTAVLMYCLALWLCLGGTAFTFLLCCLQSNPG